MEALSQQEAHAKAAAEALTAKGDAEAKVYQMEDKLQEGQQLLQEAEQGAVLAREATRRAEVDALLVGAELVAAEEMMEVAMAKAKAEFGDFAATTPLHTPQPQTPQSQTQSQQMTPQQTPPFVSTPDSLAPTPLLEQQQQQAVLAAQQSALAAGQSRLQQVVNSGM